ncbi:DUF2274 domain-containing protein [Methyloceanibacter sp.]|uniref:DUF2274 domain-containing protein n=1 Tax=Methyloceanibacter sp. TaxID=1965321 RepID=UPI002D1FB2BD|nr:DUF2274 domain-containing protein [Methyloceanibacter sp.]
MLKLAKLPDRTPVKITITVKPELNKALCDYAAAYRATYGEAESVAEIIPYMLEAFLDGDRAFAKARKEGMPESRPEDSTLRSRKTRVSDTVSPRSSGAASASIQTQSRRTDL